MKRYKVGILNVTGYVGADLARILARHPGVEITTVTGRGEAGKKLAQVFPHLAPLDLVIEPAPGEADILFSALPHMASAEALVPHMRGDIRIIDTSADFRLKDASIYDAWYDHAHPAPELLAAAVYGLPELHKAEIAKARLVANPGCYPTCTILALTPALKSGIVSGHIVVDAKSGASGAGRTLKLESHFCEVDENVSAYGLRGHRHLPEILQELALAVGESVSLTFVPHLIPMGRGMMSTCYARLKQPDMNDSDVRGLYQEFYKDCPFIKVAEAPPSTKQTLGSNMCLIYPVVDKRTGTLIVISCLDNLVKGAAGQAVQNMNLMAGFPETTGLDMLPLYP
ncbi:MAG: N-acetyl-gamma-glutamyl-phosphate reductase [Chloroflexi bacterium]|nr:N-acetyl-gamma-glutamyl-phosphate reductase [Chloroflexota bacterium]